MILDLKDKLGALPAEGGLLLGSEPDSPSGSDGGTAWQEAREALAALGYSQAELDRAWHGVKDEAENASVEVLMKKALQHLFKG